MAFVKYRTFNAAADDRIQLAIAESASTDFSPATLVACVRVTDISASRTLIGAATSGGTTRLYDYANNRAGSQVNEVDATSGGYCYAYPATMPDDDDGWAIVGWNRATSGAKPRFHRKLFSGGTWTHLDATGGNATGNLNDPATPGAGGTWMIGCDHGLNEGWKGDIAAVAYFNKVLSDAEWETLDDGLSAWLALAPVHCWRLDQATIADLVGNADQVLMSGTVLSTDDSPLAAPVGPQTWVATAATVTVTAATGTWEITGTPKTWTGSAATMAVTATSGIWSVASFGPWSDTDFININSGGNYDTYLGNPAFPWLTDTPGEVHGPAVGQMAISRRLDATTADSQFVRLTVPDLGTPVILCTHAPAPMIEFGGYCARWLGSQVYWYKDGAFQGSQSVADPSGTAGTVELRVIGGVGALLFNGVSVATKTYDLPLLTGRPHQAFGTNNSGCVITHATGGEVAAAKTWTRSPGSITVAATSGIWLRGGEQAWSASMATVTVTPTSGLWNRRLTTAPMLGTVSVKDIKIGTTDVIQAFMGSVRIWPPTPQTWTRTAATISISGSSGAWYLPGMWVFVDNFASGLTHWAPARWRSQTFSTRAGEVGPCDDVAGADGVFPPGDITVVANRLWVCTGSQNYGDSIVRCDQPFDFSGGGIIETDVILSPQDSLMGHSQVLVSDIPWAAPSSRDDNSNGPTVRYGFTIRLNYAAAYLGGTWYPSPVAVVWDEYAETKINGSVPVAVSTTDFTTVRIEFDHDQCEVFFNGALAFSASWDLPPELTQGYVYLGSHNHASDKYREVASVNSVFAGLRFDGPSRPINHCRKVADASDVYEGSMDIAYFFPTGPLTIPSVPNPATIASARLVCSVQYVAGTNPNPSTWRLNYALNGSTVHAVAFDPSPELASGAGFSIPVTVSELVAGDNTVAFTQTNFGGGYPPFIGNIQLVYTLT